MKQFTAVTKILDNKNRSIGRLQNRNLNLKKKLAKEREDTFRQFKNRIDNQQRGPRNNLGRNIIAGVASGGVGIGLINRLRNRGTRRITNSFSRSGRRFNIFRTKPRLTSSRGVNTGILRGGSKLNSLLTVAFTGYDIIDRKQQGQTNFQATSGALATTGGALAGGAAGAKLGALIGTFIVPGAGTIIGGALGGILGSFIGATAGGSIADSITGANEQKRRQLQINKFRLQKGSTIFSKALDTFDSVLDKFERLRADDFDPSLIERDDEDIVLMLDRLSEDDDSDDPIIPPPLLPPFSNRVLVKKPPKIKWDWVITFSLYAIEVLSQGVAPTESLPITKIKTKTIKVDVSKIATPKLRKIYLEYRKGNLDEVELENGIIKIINEAFEQLKVKPNEVIKNEKLNNIFQLKKNNLKQKKDGSGFINFSKFADTVQKVPSLTRAQEQIRRMAAAFKKNFPKGFKPNLSEKGKKIRGLDKIVKGGEELSEEDIIRILNAAGKKKRLKNIEILNELRKRGIAEENIQKFLQSEEAINLALRDDFQGVFDVVKKALKARELVGDPKSVKATLDAFGDFLAEITARGEIPGVSSDDISDLLMFLNRMQTDPNLFTQPDLKTDTIKKIGSMEEINKMFEGFLDTMKKIQIDQNLSMNNEGGSNNLAMLNIDGNKTFNVINEGSSSFVNFNSGSKINMMQMQGYFTV